MIFPAQEAGLELALVNPGLGGEHAAQQRLLAHFQAEDGDHGTVVDGGVLRDVDGEGGFAHGRAGGNDDQLAFLQAAGHAVELSKVGGQAGDFAALLVEVVDGAKGVADDLVEGLEAVGDAFLGDFHQLGLGAARTSMASSLWSAARAMAAEQMAMSLRSRLLSLTMRMYSSMTGRRGKPR